MSLLDARQTSPGAARRGGARQDAPAAKLRYLQVIDLIDAIIAERGLGPGDLLPTQKELASRAGVSLITVRRALDELERSGRVSGHQGVGTFVARPRIVSEPTRSGGLLATLAEQGSPREVTTQVLEVRTARPRPTVAHTLGLAPGKPVWQIVRLRLIDGQPLVVEQALIPQALAPDLGRRRGELSGSLYDLLAESHGLVDDHEEQYLEVLEAGARERRLLKLGARARVVRLRGVSFTAGDVPFDCFEQVYPADEFVFYISGQTARRLFRPADLRDWGVATAKER
ncbi:MAG TPA: GntR family transcriptional regulator [Thermoleophilia bacterium]|nr:GntR family transcriptional regulator [Thermoleophilia bacterium]